ncbi:MAG: hypothetical protein Q8880_12890 [Bacteroidota bacterium]|nr:hypothetical protein [Bacteroidota bacterium]
MAGAAKTKYLMQPHNYFLVLFEKNKFDIPKAIGQKQIGIEQYKQLCDDLFTEFETGEIKWLIKERRIFEMAETKKLFELENAITVNCYVVIDAVKKI